MTAAQPTDRGLCRFVLLSTQRSGTSWVIERLAKHEAVGGYGEMLLAGAEGWSDWPPGAKDRPYITTYLKNRGSATAWRAHRALFSYLEYLYAPRRGFRAIGFKLMYDQLLRYPEVVAYMRVRRVRILHLIRANVLDVQLSREAMAMRAHVHARTAEEREQVRVPVDTGRLLPRLVRLEREVRLARLLLDALHLPTCEVNYEDLLADDSGLLAALRFVGVQTSSAAELPAVMLKLAPRSHADGIANYDEVASALRGTRFHRLLHD